MDSHLSNNRISHQVSLLLDTVKLNRHPDTLSLTGTRPTTVSHLRLPSRYLLRSATYGQGAW